MGLLTGVSRQGVDPLNPTGSFRERQLQRSAQNVAQMQRGLRGLITGDPASTEEKLQRGISEGVRNFDAKTMQEKRGLIRALQATGQTELATQLASRMTAEATQQAATTKLEREKPVIKAFLNREVGSDKYNKLVDEGIITSENFDDFLPDLKDDTQRYLNVGGGLVFDTVTREMIKGYNQKDFIKIKTATGGEVLYNTITDEIVRDTVQLADEKTDDIIDWEFYAQQAQKDNRPVIPFEDWKAGKYKPDKPTPDKKLYDELKVDYEARTGEAYKSFSEWFEEQKEAKTLVIKNIDPSTGIEHSYLRNEQTGEKIQDLGITKLPSFEIVENADGTYYVKNNTTGERGQNVATPQAARIQQQKFESTMSAISSLDNTLGIIGEIEEKAQGFGTFNALSYDLFKYVPTTDSKYIQNKIETIQANLAFDKLEQIRKNSPTGGSLGSISNFELELLRQVVTGLDPTLGGEAFKEQLRKVEIHYNRFKASLIGDLPNKILNEKIYVQSPDGNWYEVPNN